MMKVSFAYRKLFICFPFFKFHDFSKLLCPLLNVSHFVCDLLKLFCICSYALFSNCFVNFSGFSAVALCASFFHPPRTVLFAPFTFAVALDYSQ